jgi:hypothetical protein
VKKNGFRKHLGGLLIGLSVIAMPMTVSAVAPAGMDECARELLLSYFPEQFVNETLERYNVPRDKWASINQALSAQDKEIIRMVEERASQISPNPLKDPQQRQAAVKLFRETLLKVFSDAMRANGVTNEQDYQAMLDDIQKQKAKKFAQCMQRQREEQQQAEMRNRQPQDAARSSDRGRYDDDYDDDDYDDDDHDDDRYDRD